uniref:Uncharacterized protein n=1 Tax=Onchocerca volvulus TaxID=6282 RepID=A0A8R1TMU0_ONCVO
MLMNIISIDWDKWGEMALVLISSIDCVVDPSSNNQRVVYPLYLLPYALSSDGNYRTFVLLCCLEKSFYVQHPIFD